MSQESRPGTPSGLSYRAAGVDIDSADRLLARIKPAVNTTLRAEVLGGLGGFGALFELPVGRYRRPVLVSGTDGVGTKLKLAQQLSRHHGIGIDLVAMCVNDILVQGAEPLFFLDYYAAGRLDVDTAAEVIQGIAQGCREAGAALVGGETAEMPGMYAPGDYDLAGFCVGIVERDRLLDGSRVRPGDRLLGLASSGAHSNGYSLIRKVLETSGTSLSQAFGDTTLGEALLVPTRIYVRALLPLLGAGQLHALAHITGGGITQNLPRVLPSGCRARVRTHTWPRPEIFRWLQSQGGIAEAEMLRTFNCGIGMVAVVPERECHAVTTHCERHGVQVWPIGEIEAAEASPSVAYA